MSDALISRTQRTRYGILAAPIAFAGIPLYIHAPDFYATEMGVPLATLGTILLLLRLIDAVQDPLIGFLCDRFRERRLVIMLGAALALVVGFAALFHPFMQGVSAPLWFAAAVLVATTAYSVLSINLNALGALWSRDSHVKTRITSTREAFGLLGLLLAVLVPSVLQQNVSKALSFSALTAVLAVFLAFALSLFVRWYRAQHAWFSAAAGATKPAAFAAALRQIPGQAQRFFLVYGISMLASAFPAVLILFFVRDRLNAEAYAGAFLALYFVAAALAMPLWERVSRAYGKPATWFFAMLLAIASFVWAFFLQQGDGFAFAVICVLSGMAFGAELALPPSLLADMLQRHRLQASASLYFGIMAFLLKFAVALASLLAFGLLDVAGFRPAQANSETALLWLSACYALLPCLMKLAAAALLYSTAFTSQFTTTSGASHEQNNQSDRSTSHGH